MYNSKEIENEIIDLWNRKKENVLNNLNKKNNYSIILPPPNITGPLHIGHAFQQTIMDVLIRYNKMNGKNVFWQYGIDHAGIATQITIEKKINSYKEKLKLSNKKYNSYLKEAWIWKKKINEKIIFQMKRMGNFIDFSNNRFTLDKRFNNSVKTAFIELYNNDFIYKNKKIVNWDTTINSVISDLEINYKESLENMWNIKFPILNNNYLKNTKNKFIIISTTRPETLLGDSAIAVNPKDNRYIELIGKHVLIPIINRTVPIISDERIDMLKGTGCVKITPAHSFEDYDIGVKHLLPIINVFTKEGNISKYAEISYFCNPNLIKYEILPNFLHNINIAKARKIIIEKLINMNLLDSVKKYKTIIPYSNKTNSIVENLITNQWFIRTKELSKKSIDIVKKNKIEFIQKKYKNIFFNWMDDVKDWCISRQIWWGHKIPVWYDLNKNIYVGFNEKLVRKKYKLEKSYLLYKENDVLDTWFSSSLWTFASLGWPKNTKKLKYFHPADIVISGFDIIFFWISRMIMITLFFIKNKSNISQVPFKKIYITALIKDENNKKMSKSKGNVIDPIDIVNGISIEKLINKKLENSIDDKDKNKIINFTKKKFPNGIDSQGADALRFTFTTMSYSNDKNINLDLNIIKGYKNFCNKLWNASKFVFNNINEKNKIKKIKFNSLRININKWIFVELNNLTKKISNEIKNYRLDLYAKIIYDFTWNEFCNWYLEFSKYFLKNENESIKNEIKYVLIYILDKILKILHPIIPFLTEKIWQKLQLLNNVKNYNLIILNKFPKFNYLIKDIESINTINFIKNIIINIRNLINKINYNNELYLIINSNLIEKINLIKLNKKLILSITKLKEIILNNEIQFNNLNLVIKKKIDNIELIILT